jgi:hypothetical protein
VCWQHRIDGHKVRCLLQELIPPTSGETQVNALNLQGLHLILLKLMVGKVNFLSERKGKKRGTSLGLRRSTKKNSPE